VGDDEVLVQVEEGGDPEDGEGVQQHCGGGDARRRVHGGSAFPEEGAVRSGGR
jgi:hypothetical protein